MRLLFVIYDNGSYVNDFPLGPAYLISVLRRHGYRDISIYHQDIYHYPDEHLTDYLKRNHFDVVGIGTIAGYYQYAKLKGICRAIHQVPDRPLIVLGGHGPSPIPEYYLQKMQADVVVMGEAERILPELLDTLAAGRSLAGVKGIAWREGDQVYVNPRQEPVKDLDSLPFPAWDAFPIDHYALRYGIEQYKNLRSFPILSCRGCMYKCSFCYRMERGWRLRSLDAIIEEMKQLMRDYQIRMFRFRDELLMGTKQRAIEFCERILSEGLDIKFDCNGRLNVASPEVLALMKRAGCTYINYGIESLDQRVLDLMNKKQTVEEIYYGIENTIAAGIHPGFNVLWGCPGDNEKTLQKNVEFLLKYDTCSEPRNIKPVIPYPGSDLYYYAIEKGLLEGPEDFYERKHLNSDLFTCNFTEIEDEEVLYQLLLDANIRLLENYYRKTFLQTKSVLESLYIHKDVSFRGLRP